MAGPQNQRPDQAGDDAGGFGRDVLAWLAERGVERRPIRVDPTPTGGGDGAPTTPAPPDQPSPPPGQPGPATPPAPGGSQSPAGEDGPDGRDGDPTGESGLPDERDPDAAPRRLEEEVADAVAYARRSTAQAPKSEAKLREAMQRRELAPAVIEQALRHCRDEGIVDDVALAAALVEEGLRKAHAPKRLRRDLGRRGLTADVIDAAVAHVEAQDQEGRAYDAAAKRASQLQGADNETAFRRIVGHLARRGYPEPLARRVARQAVFNDRESWRTAER